MIDEYYEGKGCKCHAHSEWECCCNVDWTDPEVYELRNEVKELKEKIDRIKEESYKEGYAKGIEWNKWPINKWKEAVLEELITWHIYSKEHENDPKKALHDLALVHSDVAIYFHEQKKWYKKLMNKIFEMWYMTPFPYWLYKIGRIQPPF